MGLRLFKGVSFHLSKENQVLVAKEERDAMGVKKIQPQDGVGYRVLGRG